jgi:AcrR family transcriptional regulator
MGRGRPREFDPEKALEAAMMLFWQHGYEGTSVAALTQAMGINGPSLYAAFGNKEELFRKVIARYIEKPASYLPAALLEPTARQVAEKLLQGAIDMVMRRGHPDGCLLVHGALVVGPGAEWARKDLSRSRRRAEDAIRCRFAQAMAEGDLPPTVDDGKLARFIISVIWGMSVQAAGGASRAHLKDVAEQAMRSWPTT